MSTVHTPFILRHNLNCGDFFPRWCIKVYMWQLAVPLALCACQRDEAILILVGVVAIFVLTKQSSLPPVVYGPKPYVSARTVQVAIAEEPPVREKDENETDRVENPRRATNDVVKETESDGIHTSTAHIVGFNRPPSNESRSRLLSRQRDEMRSYHLHQYQ
jgi:hypothetical protein